MVSELWYSTFVASILDQQDVFYNNILISLDKVCAVSRTGTPVLIMLAMLLYWIRKAEKLCKCKCDPLYQKYFCRISCRPDSRERERKNCASPPKIFVSKIFAQIKGSVSQSNERVSNFFSFPTKFSLQMFVITANRDVCNNTFILISTK